MDLEHVEEVPSGEELVVEIKLTTKDAKIRIPPAPFTAPVDFGPKEITQLICDTLKPDESDEEEKEGDQPSLELGFLIGNEYLVTTLAEYLKEKNLTEEGMLEIEYHELVSEPETRPDIPHEDWVSGISSRLHSSEFMTVSYDGALRVYSKASNLLLTVPVSTDALTCIVTKKINDASSLVCVAGQEGVVYVFRFHGKTMTPIGKLQGHDASVTAIAVSESLKTIATGDESGAVNIYKIGDVTTAAASRAESSAKRTRTGAADDIFAADSMRGHTDRITSIGFTPERLWTSSMDCTFRVWDVETGATTAVIRSPKAIMAATMTDNFAVSTVHHDGILRTWDARIARGHVSKTEIQAPGGIMSAVAACSSEPQIMACSSYDGNVRILDARCRKPLYTLNGHEGKALCVDWSSDSIIRSGGSDKKVKVFKTKF